MIYIALTILLFSLSIKLMLNKHYLNYSIYYFILFALFCFSAFRYQVGCDWDGMIYMYLNASDINFSDIVGRRDPLFWTILMFMQKMDILYPFVNIISSGIFFIGIHALARRQPDPISFLILLFPILIMNMPV